MTAFNKVFQIRAGERKDLEFPVSDMSDLSGYTLDFYLKENEDSTTNLLSKESPTITLSGNMVTVPLMKADTQSLVGTYYYELKITDANGEFNYLAEGTISIK